MEGRNQGRHHALGRNYQRGGVRTTVRGAPPGTPLLSAFAVWPHQAFGTPWRTTEF